MLTSSLRKTMTAVVLTVALLAVVAAAALVGFTTMIHAASLQSSVAAENVILAEVMHRALALHERLQDPSERHQVAERLVERRTTIQSHVRSQTERDAVEAVERAVSHYLEAIETRGTLKSEVSIAYAGAFSAVEALVAVEMRQAESARATVKRYDDLAEILGAFVAAMVIVAATLMVWWLHARALRPLFALARQVRRFGQGHVDEQACEQGPAEVVEMAKCFNEMAAALARQKKERETFIASVVHDLRNPLSVLRMSTALLRAQEPEVAPKQVAKVLGAVGRQVDRLDRMLGDLLDNAIIESGHVKLHWEEHDARALAAEIVDLYASASRAHTIDLDVPPTAISLRCDGMRLEQVLSNLMSNAIKYSPEGGRVLLQVKLSETGDVVFAISDQGVGMNDEDASNAFEPFRRGARLRDQVPGAGLGLSVVRRLIEAHGGRVELRTLPGRGSTFEVRLPATRKVDSLES